MDPPADPAARKAFLKELHELKTDLFNSLIDTGALPLRPGVKRLIGERAEGVACGCGRGRGAPRAALPFPAMCLAQLQQLGHVGPWCALQR